MGNSSHRVALRSLPDGGGYWYDPRFGRFDSGFTGRVKFGSVTCRLSIVEEGWFLSANHALRTSYRPIVGRGREILFCIDTNDANGVTVCVLPGGKQ